ncbi:ABC transporter permease [Rhodovibrionaceae bacterium A322]
MSQSKDQETPGMAKNSDNSAKMEHYVNPAPFNAYEEPPLTPEQERYYMASQWRIMWWKFKRHRLAMVSAYILGFFFLLVLFAEIVAPYNLDSRNIRYIYAPPQSLHLFNDEGEFVGPFVYGYKSGLDPVTFRRTHVEDKKKVYPLRFFCRGDKYDLWGVIPGSFHLVCPAEKKGTLFLWGTDRLGRDLLSRIIYGTRISMTIGLVSVVLSFVLGIVIGGLAGYYGGRVDSIVQRIIEILKSFPELPLFMTLSAILPVNWSPVTIFFGISIIMALLDWPGLARAVRSKFFSLREEDFTTAAQLMGAKPPRIIGRHLLPSFASHLIASATLSIPQMILAETALSFLGLGLRAPVTSWGVLLNDAQDISVVKLYPWLMLPVVPVFIVVIAYNYLGDGLRDAADPYK